MAPAMIPEDMVREILLKLPTRDVVRCCCVSPLWRAVVRDPSFRTLHASSDDDEDVLLVTKKRVVYSVSSGKPMCRLVVGAATDSCTLTNACNGFLCLAPASLEPGTPAFVCNPAVTDILEVPAPPPPPFSDVDFLYNYCLFALGFSPSTGEYKLFRLALGEILVPGSDGNCYIDVYTLGGGAGAGRWREHPRLFPCHEMCPCPTPTLVDGKLYVLTTSELHRHTVLVIDVASEEHCTHELPRTYDRNQEMRVIDMDGRPYLTVHYVEDYYDEAGWHKLQVWAMHEHEEEEGLEWDLMYVFDMADVSVEACCWEWEYMFLLTAAWYDAGAGMLCYRLGDHLFKSSVSTLSSGGGVLQWDYHLRLPKMADLGIYAGYRPTLLSPLALMAPAAAAQQEDDGPCSLLSPLVDDDRAGESLLAALRQLPPPPPPPPRHENEKRQRCCSPQPTAPKRICVSE